MSEEYVFLADWELKPPDLFVLMQLSYRHLARLLHGWAVASSGILTRTGAGVSEGSEGDAERTEESASHPVLGRIHADSTAVANLIDIIRQIHDIETQFHSP